MSFLTRRNYRVSLFWALLLLLPAAAARSQTATGTLHGQVTDPSGSAVATAKVTVTWPNGKVSTAETTHEGRFEIKDLPPGKYGVNVTAKGFAPFEVLDYEIEAGQSQKLDVTLTLEVQKEKVIVESTSPAVEVSPEQNAGAIVMTQKDLDALSDDPDELQNDLEALAGPSAGPNGGQIYIDGFTGGQLPPKSAIREIRINQNPFSPEYDKLGYGRIEIFTKPGMDQLHGNFEFQGNDSAFNSKNPFATEEPGYYSVLYNGNIGGPISKKASFFFSSQYRDINDVAVVNAQILDPEFNPVPFSESIPSPRTRVNLSPRVDIQLTPNNTLSIRYQYFRDDLSNQGVGGFNLDSQAYHSLTTEHTVQISDTQVIGTKIVNETRFQFLHSPYDQTPVNGTDATIIVPGAFVGGGSSAGLIEHTQNHYELQNYTQIALTKHTVKFGVRFREVTDDNFARSGFNGTYNFSSLETYESALQGTGGLPTQFTITEGNPDTNASMFDAGIYVSDDWKVRPNITVSSGLRLEAQSGIPNHLDWAPRVAVAWGIGHGKGGPKTVIRAGTGIFYDRFAVDLLLQAKRLNGINQSQCVYANPTFFPDIPTITTPGMCPGNATAVLPTIYRIAPNLHAPGVLQTAVVLERQLNKVTSLSLTYLNARGFDQLLTNNINTPLPGTYPAAPVYPLGMPANVYQYQSEGVFRQNQLFVQVTVRAGARLTLFSNYVLNYANSDTSGAGSFPSNPFNLQQDYGRASFDYRNRFFMGGSIGMPHGFRVFPFMVVSSGQPYSITLSQDLIGSSQFNQRPAFASAASLPQNVVMTKFGAFDTVPEPGENIVPINSLVGPPRFTLNLRLSKTWGFGNPPERAGESVPGGGGPGGGPGRGRGGFGGLFGGAPTNKRYNLTFSVNARNLFNYQNLNTPTAVLNPPNESSPVATESPYFGRSNQLAFGPFSSQSASRLIYLQLGFSF
ncbi:MAG TPA: carboxypeptidase-like regulatory domain-containing protein [Patescibacteria group bacterium]|nr:carboxypeptidase-like regulatory domain-containing protein [Patescibacteria group bacterium]